MSNTYRIVDGATVVHLKNRDDETYCGEDAGETIGRIEVSRVEQIGTVRGKNVCRTCRENVVE